MELPFKIAMIIYFVVAPIMAITGYMYNTLLMFYFAMLGIISIMLTVFEE